MKKFFFLLNYSHNINNSVVRNMSWNTGKKWLKQSAYLYVVWSLGWELIQLGYTQDLATKIETLNNKSSCGVNDWEFLYSAKYSDIQKVVSNIWGLLKKHSSQKKPYYLILNSLK